MTGGEWWAAGGRIKILAGHYGSGKTEIALNMALKLRALGCEVALIDLDIVNPFFRSAERGELLRSVGVQLIAPPFALTGVDVRALPAEIQSVFERSTLRAVFDVGGDDAGAVALGQYAARLQAAGAELYYVVNPFRPRSATVREIVDMIDRVSDRARLQPTGLINNANLGGETTPAELDAGERLLLEVSAVRGIPVVAASGTREVLSRRSGGAPVFEIERLMKPEWMDA